jgi:hypothetical protein
MPKASLGMANYNTRAVPTQGFDGDSLIKMANGRDSLKPLGKRKTRADLSSDSGGRRQILHVRLYATTVNFLE